MDFQLRPGDQRLVLEGVVYKGFVMAAGWLLSRWFLGLFGGS